MNKYDWGCLYDIPFNNSINIWHAEEQSDNRV